MSDVRYDMGFAPQLGFSALAESKPGASERAKYKIARALEELMLTQSYSGISVMSIADRAGVSRQTFYNHFIDKEDLIAWIGGQLNLATVSKIGISLTWEEAIRRRLEFMKSKEPFYSELFGGGSHSHEGKRNEEVDTLFRAYEEVLGRIAGFRVGGRTRLELSLYCYGHCGLVSEWASSGMVEPIEMMVSALRSTLPSFAQKILLGE